MVSAALSHHSILSPGSRQALSELALSEVEWVVGLSPRF
jgi:hypothetical protein